MRRAGWEQRLACVVERHAAMPFAWGSSDCFALASDAVEAVTGEAILAPYRTYAGERGAARALLAHGFACVADCFARHFPELPPALAQRGDLGVVKRDGASVGAVMTAGGWACRAERGLLFEPVTAASRAFKVG